MILRIIASILLAMPFSKTGTATAEQTNNNMIDSTTEEAVYEVVKSTSDIKINADWNKEEWKNIKTINVEKHMGDVPPFVPVVESKMMYNDQHLFVIFRVQDRFVQSTVTKINGPVSENSCVEFFFSPDVKKPLHYFNLEVNAGGTPLIFFVTKPWTDFEKLSEEDIKKITIAHSMPAVVDPEVKDPVTWTIEYSIPISMLKKYCDVTPPVPGVKWKANFYKTGSNTSNPNYMTWARVEFPKPNFHLPQFFGTLIFK